MELHGYEYYGIVVGVIDGDTLRGVFALGWGDYKGSERKPVSCRLIGVWAPELSAPAGPEAKAWLSARLLGKDVYGISHSGTPDKYGRLLMTLYEPPGADKSVNQEIIEAGLAKAAP